ncbi:MAG: lytic transglycosylase domain-containing protein, partial [Bacteroidota bacterium]
MRTQLLLCISAVILLSLPANMDLGFQDTNDTRTEFNYEAEFQADGKPTFTEEDYKRRIEGLSGDIEFSYNKTVRRHIQNYLRYAPHLTERLIGKTTIYFPVFEEALEASGLPTDLKYLSVVESKLEPDVISPVGAGGLWQFMPGTAREKGLTINQLVDERFDAHRSTEAAIAYLKELNELYNDWILAIAAYNCGPGRVNKAIRRANSKNFWKLYPHLPKETRSYVPAFISVAYLMNYYSLHGLNP